MTEIKDTDWAYAAGFVDGEGCIAIVRSFEPSRGRYYYGVNVVVSNNDRGVLDSGHLGRLGGRGFSRGQEPSLTTQLELETRNNRCAALLDGHQVLATHKAVAMR